MRFVMGFSDDTAWVWNRIVDTNSLTVTTSVRPTADAESGVTQEAKIGRVSIPALHQAIRLANVDQWPRITAARPGKIQADRLWTMTMTGGSEPANIKVPFEPPDWGMMEQALCRLVGSEAMAVPGALSLDLKVEEKHGMSIEIELKKSNLTISAGQAGKVIHQQNVALRGAEIDKIETAAQKAGAWGWMPYYLDRHGKGEKIWSFRIGRGDAQCLASGRDRLPEGFSDFMDALTRLALKSSP